MSFVSTEKNKKILPTAVHSPAINAGGHPVDSSRMLLQLTCFTSAQGSTEPDANDPLAGIISPVALRKLLTALNYRDIRTVRHSRRVARLCVGLAEYLGWETAAQKKLEVAALLHDIGKIGVPDHILFKPGKLSPDETELMAFHHNVSIDILQACHAHPDIIQFVVQAHRHYDCRLDNVKRKRQQPTQGARILAIADAYDSLASEQAYRPAKSHYEIMEILEENSGTQFDGNLIAAMARWIAEEGITLDSDLSDSDSLPVAQVPDDPQTAFEALSLSHMFSSLHVLESLYDGFYIVDADQKVSIWNRGMEHLTQQAGADVVGRPWSADLCKYGEKNKGTLKTEETPLQKVTKTRRGMTSMVEITLEKGKTAELEVQTIPLLDQMGRLHGVAEIVRNLSRNSRHPQEYRELQIAASQDALTSVANRGELETQLAELISDFSKDPKHNPFSIIFLDVDFFKNINDTFGHTVGDNVLIDLARLMRNQAYSGETVGRYGGEEFVILCPATSLEQAVQKAERIRISIPKTNIGGMPEYQITASFGVAECEVGDSIESLLRRADKALYTAKETGRNKTCSFSVKELLTKETAPDVAKTEDLFKFESSFRACVAADMLVCKMKGFVADYGARIREVNNGHTLMRIGRRTLFGGWGRSDHRRPVEVNVEFGDQRVPQGRQGGLRQTTVSVTIVPVGRPQNAEQFQQRARRIIRVLRSYFAASHES